MIYDTGGEMSKIKLLTLLSTMVVVFMFSFDTHAATGNSLTDAIDLIDGQEYIHERSKYVYYQYTSSEAAGYRISLKNKNDLGSLGNYRSEYYLNEKPYLSPAPQRARAERLPSHLHRMALT